MTTTLSPTLPATTATPPPPARSPRIVRAMRHSATLCWRALVRIRRNPEQLLDVTLQPIIFVTMFVFLFGGAMVGMDRHQYLQFTLPGIMVQTLVFASVGTGVGLNSDITKGIFDRFRSMPIARSAPLVGAIGGDLFRYVASLVVLLTYGIILGFRVQTSWWNLIPGTLLIMVFAFALCWVWALLGMYVKSPQSVQGFGFIIMFPLTFGSNVFVRASTLPGWLQAWVNINPVTYLSNAMRGLLLGGPVADPVLKSLLCSLVILAVFAPLAVRKYRRIA